MRPRCRQQQITVPLARGTCDVPPAQALPRSVRLKARDRSSSDALWAADRSVPVILTIRGSDRHVVDGGQAPAHEAARVEFPILVPVGTEPVPGVVVPLVGEAHGNAVPAVCPDLMAYHARSRPRSVAVSGSMARR